MCFSLCRDLTIPEGQGFGVCPRGGDKSIACDQGATAFDEDDGDLTYRLRACAGDGTRQSLWLLAGLAACNLTSQTAPGIYTIVYSVTDLSGATTTANRTVRIAQRCPAGSNVCADMLCPDDDGSCVRPGSLGSGNLLGTTAVAVNVNKPPTITLNTTSSLGLIVPVVQGDTYEVCMVTLAYLTVLSLTLHAYCTCMHRAVCWPMYP